MRLALGLRGIIAAASIAATIAAPPQGPAPSAPPVKTPAYEHVEVRLAQLDVVVRDKAGHVVSGLSPKDFSVFEDGVPLEVVAVDEWGRPETAPAAKGVPQTPAPAPETPAAAAEPMARAA